jgi:hypothetical protein
MHFAADFDFTPEFCLQNTPLVTLHRFNHRVQIRADLERLKQYTNRASPDVKAAALLAVCIHFP